MPQFSLRPDQVTDLSLLIQNPRFMNLSDPGTGKTPTTCVYIEYLYRYKGIQSVWVMPKSLLKKNKDEFALFTNLEPDQIVIVDGTPAEREAQIAKPAAVYLMGFRRFSDDCKRFAHCKAFIADEWHLGFATNDSARTQRLYQFMDHADYFMPMTGTLIRGRMSSAFPAINIIEPRYYGNIVQFENYHAVRDPWTGKITDWTNHEKLGRILLAHSVRHTFEEVYGQKPEPIWIPEKIEMTTKQRAAYDKFQEQAYLELEKYILDGTIPGVATIRARQIMAHPETFGIHKPGELTGKDERLLIDLADHKNTGDPLVIFGTLIPELERVRDICVAEGFKVSYITGQVTGKKRDDEEENFRLGKTQIMVASEEVAACGYNWGHNDHFILYNYSYQDTDIRQALFRFLRGKRDRLLRGSVYEYEDSIDQRILWIVQKKSMDANKVDPTQPVLNFHRMAA